MGAPNPNFRFVLAAPTVLSLFCRFCNQIVAWSSHPRILLLVEEIHLRVRHPER